MWKPFETMTQEDESVIEGYLELACSPSVGHGGRNKELAIHYLHSLGGSVKVSTFVLVKSIQAGMCPESETQFFCDILKLCFCLMELSKA